MEWCNFVACSSPEQWRHTHHNLMYSLLPARSFATHFSSSQFDLSVSVFTPLHSLCSHSVVGRRASTGPFLECAKSSIGNGQRRLQSVHKIQKKHMAWPVAVATG